MQERYFLDQVERLKTKIYRTSPDTLETNGSMWTYLVISSNLANYLPHIDEGDHFKIIQDILFHKAVSSIDLSYPHLLKDTQLNDASHIVSKSFKNAHIYVSYHAGCYNMFLRHIVEKDLPFCIVANQNYIKDHKNTVQKLYKNIPDTTREELQILPAEDPTLIRKLINNLKNGISVCIFIDGNTGTQKNELSESKNVLKIDFLNHHIYARQGVGLLAYLSKAPIAIVTSKRNDNLKNEVHIKRLDTKDNIEKLTRNDFTALITKMIYGALEKYVLTQYNQWAGWLYIHTLFNEPPEETSNSSTKIVNHRKDTFKTSSTIHLIKHKEHTFLVTKRNYEIKKINAALFDVLTHFKKPQKLHPHQPMMIANHNIGWRFIEELLEMKFLIPHR